MAVSGHRIPNDARFKKNGPYLDVRHAGYVGAFGALLFMICWLIMVFVDGDWSPGTDMVSGLGLSESSIVRNMFAMSCAISGVAMILCGYSFVRYTPSFWTKVSYTLSMTGGILLICVGLFDMGYEIHNYCAAAMCVLLIVAVVTMGICDCLEHRYGLVIFSLSLGVFCLLVLLFLPGYDQSAAILSLLLWSFVRSCVFIRLDDKRLEHGL